MAATTPSSPQSGDAGVPMPELVSFTFDLTTHEVRRLSAVLDAMPDWDPAAVLAAEAEAYVHLYSDLDADQRAVYALLVEEGVLDDRS